MKEKTNREKTAKGTSGLGIKDPEIVRIGSIPGSLTAWGYIAVLIILTVTVLALAMLPSPAGDGGSFLKLLLSNMHLLN